MASSSRASASAAKPKLTKEEKRAAKVAKKEASRERRKQLWQAFQMQRRQDKKLLPLVLGVVLMFVWQARHPAYFRGQTLPKRAADELVLARGGTQQPRVALPDSGEMATVIAPDRSNLPPGATAVRPQDQEPEDR